MAATWNRYAAGVLVAAGIAITGTMFWERGAALRGEDVAALNAEIARRAMWYRLTGDQHPSNTWDDADVKIGAALAWRALYGEPQGAVPYGDGAWHGMDGARKMALCESGPLWLDAAAPRPADGDVIADCNAYYELAGTSTESGYYGGTYEKEMWRLTATNHVDKLATAAGRSGNNKTWPRVASSNAPLSRRWHGVTNALSEHDWWETIGNGTTNYIFACEKKPCVVLDKVYGGPCEIVTNEIDIASAGDSATVHIQMPESNNYPRATVWKTRHRKGEDGDGEEQHLVVETGAWNPLKEIYTTIPLYTLAEGSWTRLEFYTRTHPNDMPEGVTNTIDFDIVYSSGNLRATPYPDHPIWFKQYKGHPRGDTRMIYVTATNDNDTADSVIVWRVGYLGQTYEYIIYCPDTKPATTHDLKFSRAAIQSWTGTPNPAETTTLTLDKDTAVWPPQTGRATAKKNLSQAYNVVTNLTRAAAFLAWDSAAASNIVRWSGSAHTGAVYAAGAPDLAGEAGGMFAAAVAAAASNETGLAQWVCRGAASGWYEGDGFGRHDWSADGGAEWYEARGASLPWPCAAAFASGLVARVEIFAVLAQDLYDNVATPYRGNYIPAGASDVSFTYSGGSRAAAAVALAPWARLPALEDRAAESGAAKTTHMSGGFAGQPHALPLRLTRVAAAEHPDAPPVFDVSFPPAGSATASGAETLAFSYTDLGFSYTGRRLQWTGGVLLLGWFVVADWAF
jgi:hypothetical protein